VGRNTCVPIDPSEPSLRLPPEQPSDDGAEELAAGERRPLSSDVGTTDTYAIARAALAERDIV
jgi:hypothetical protein